MQRPARLTGGQPLVGQGRVGARLVCQNADHGVQRRVHRINASQVRIDRFDRAQLSARDALREFSGRELPDFAHERFPGEVISRGWLHLAICLKQFAMPLWQVPQSTRF